MWQNPCEGSLYGESPSGLNAQQTSARSETLLPGNLDLTTVRVAFLLSKLGPSKRLARRNVRFGAPVGAGEGGSAVRVFWDTEPKWPKEDT